MCNKRKFLENNKAVSEEFTTLPALVVVMIGFSIFILVISNVYSAYNHRINTINNYQTASFIANKLTNPDCFFMMEGGIVNLSCLENSYNSIEENTLEKLREEIGFKCSNLSIIISWDDKNIVFEPKTLSQNSFDKIAVSKTVSIYLNEVQTKPGKLTVVTWRDF